jgi:DNA mismatch repair protein MutL
MTIQKLADHVINQIAAGEVVERPASVIKELVENSLDANASSIEVEITAGGKAYMRVADDGLGIKQSDLPLVFERHATSKIASLEDLEQVVSLGFRGEALASISSVAKVSVSSKFVDDNQAYTLTKDGAVLGEVQPSSLAKGTTITVEDLFRDVPVRQKYLKTDLTEYGYIASTIMHQAAAHPHVQFRLISDGKEKISLHKANELLVRALAVLKLSSPDDVFAISYQSSDMQLHGYIGMPQNAQKNRKKQYVSVNGRPLSLPFVDKAIRDAMHTLIPQGIYPVFVLHITIDPTAVDINVHPRKLEARFAYQQFVYQKVKAAVKAAVEKQTLRAAITLPPRQSTQPSAIPQGGMNHPTAAQPLTRQSFSIPGGGNNLSFSPASQPSQQSFSPQISEQAHDFNRSFAGLAPIPNQIPASITPLAQIDNSYLIARDNDGLYIIDQHAAHERIRYYELQKAREQYNQTSETTGQQLLTPADILLNQDELVILEQYQSALTAVGFSYQIANEGVMLTSVPASMHKEDYVAVFKGVITDLQDGQDGSQKGLEDVEARIETVINYTACRSAIKFGRTLTVSEQVELLRRLEEVENNYSCPHGRPTRISLTFKELEKQFGRLGVQG